MTNVQKQSVKDAILLYCSTKEISKRELATRIGVSAATISNILNDKWESIDDKLWMLVWNYVNPEHLDGIIETTDFKSVYQLCKSTRVNKWMSGLTGDTGLGKTTALTVVAKMKNVYYYYIDGTVTPKIFLKGLLQEMGVQFEGSLNDMLSRAADELNTQQEPLLILDECAKLSDKMMLILHSLRDKTMLNCGLVLAGMPDFKNRLMKYANKGTTGYAEFLRRVNIWQELSGLTPREIQLILEQHGISDKDEQKSFRNYKRFGDLMNEIKLYKVVSAQ